MHACRQCKAAPKDYVDYIDSSMSQAPETDGDDSDDFGTLYSRRPSGKSGGKSVGSRRSGKSGGGKAKSSSRQRGAFGDSSGGDSAQEDEDQPTPKQVAHTPRPGLCMRLQQHVSHASRRNPGSARICMHACRVLVCSEHVATGHSCYARSRRKSM